MLKHVLAATDGSAFATRAVRYAANLAKATGARLTILTVTPTWAAIALSEIAQGHFEKEFSARTATQAAAILAAGTAAAAEAGQRCETIHATGDRAADVIVKTAAAAGADTIVVGAHGRSGLERMILGSETVKVLSLSRIPVIVYRE